MEYPLIALLDLALHMALATWHSSGTVVARAPSSGRGNVATDVTSWLRVPVIEETTAREKMCLVVKV